MVRIDNLNIFEVEKSAGYGIITAESLATASLWALPLRALRGCVIDGLAKMLLQAGIFASWYNNMKTIFRR